MVDQITTAIHTRQGQVTIPSFTSTPSALLPFPTSEKVRFVTVLFGGGAIIDVDVDAIAKIWRSITSSEERRQVRRVSEARLPEVDNPGIQTRLHNLLAESR